MSDTQMAAFAAIADPRAKVQAWLEAIKKPPRRRRGLTLAKALKDAAKAGLKPSAATIGQDGKIELRFDNTDDGGAPIETPEQLKRLI